MIELLKAIRQQLQSELSYIREGDIFITPHIGFIPQGVMRPCIGIKDGKDDHSYGAGHSKENKLYVRLAIFTDLSNQEYSIVGNPVSNVKGVLEIKTDCIAALEGNKLGIKGMTRVKVVADPESESFIVKGDAKMQRKQLGFLYEKQS
jgi:hypothetical protein